MVKLAALYGCPVEEMLRVAGMAVATGDDLAETYDPLGDFVALVLDPDLGPPGFDDDWIDAFSDVQMEQWVDFALKLEVLIKRFGRCVQKLVDVGPLEDAAADVDGTSPRRRRARDQGSEHPRLVTRRMYYWRFNPRFGSWLRAARAKAEGSPSIEEAAEWLEIPYNQLQRLESGERKRPNPNLCDDIAHHYDLHVEDVLEAAGYEVREFRRLDLTSTVERNLSALVLIPDLKPVRMSATWLESYSDLMKRQWIELAFNIEAWVLDDCPPLEDLFEQPRVSPSILKKRGLA